MTFYQVLCLVGIPGIIASMWAFMFAWVKDMRRENNAIKAGIQAVLRNNLIELYEKYYHEGSAPFYIKDNYENMYKQYHALGANGVMDSYYKQFMDLPTERED